MLRNSGRGRSQCGGAALARLPCVRPAGTPVYNVAAPGAVRQAEFSRIAARRLGRPCLLPTPGLPLRLALGEQAELLTRGQRVVPQQLLQSGFAFRFPDAEAALADLC